MLLAGPVRAEVNTSEVPPSVHGAVETQAVTLGNGAAALLVDPGTAYAYSTLDRDDYGGGSVSYTMTARGANLNLGTIAYAVIWAAPSCDQKADPNAPNVPCVLSGGAAGTPDTGLEDAAGFPGYAEALYPAPPPPGADHTSSYKCVVNKDSTGEAPTGGAAQAACRAAGPGASDSVPLTSWAETNGKEYRATGFSRVGGATVPGAISVVASESHSEVRAIGGGKVQSDGYSVLHDVSIADGQIHIALIRSTGKVVSDSAGNATRDVDCTFSGLTVAGQGVQTTGGELPADQLKPLLDQVYTATGYKVEIIAPTKHSGVEQGGKQVVACEGLQIKFTDTHTESPVPACLPPIDPMVPTCVPALANREELHLGKMSIQQSVTAFAPAAAGGDTVASSGGGSSGSPMGDALGGSVLGSTVTAPDTSGSGTGSTTSSGDTAVGAPSSGSGTPEVAVSAPVNSIPTSLVSKGRNLALIGGLTVAAGLSILLVTLLLMGVVNSMATGTPLRLPLVGGWFDLPR